MALDRTALIRRVVRYAPSARLRETAWDVAERRSLATAARRFRATTRSGTRMQGDQQFVMPRCIYWFGVWEPALTDWLHRTLRPGDCFIDVGANDGYFSLIASRCVGPSGQVAALEPSSLTRRALEANIGLNAFSENIRVAADAAGHERSLVQLYRAPWNDAENSLIPQSGLEADEQVTAAPLQELLKAEEMARARVIKIDVEGSEHDVLAGVLRDPSWMLRTVSLAIEVHADVLADRGLSVEDLANPFRDLGFRVGWLPVDFSERAHLHSSAGDAVRRDAAPAGQLVHLILERVEE